MRTWMVAVIVALSVLLPNLLCHARLRARCRRLASLLAKARNSARQAWADAHRLRAESQQASRAHDLSIAVLAHELRRPLTPLLATVSMLEEDPRLSRQTRDSLASVHRSCELAARLVDDLRDLARADHGKFSLHRRPVALETVIADAVEVCRADITAMDITLAVETGGGPYIVLGDAHRLQQVFWNLIKNAAKFTPPGGRICLSCHRGQDGQILAQVSDNGEGIEPAVLSTIFQPFEQAGRGQQAGGLGLGLAISKTIVELHGGTISAYSSGSGKGATFTLRLPPQASS